MGIESAFWFESVPFCSLACVPNENVEESDISEDSFVLQEKEIFGGNLEDFKEEEEETEDFDIDLIIPESLSLHF